MNKREENKERILDIIRNWDYLYAPSFRDLAAESEDISLGAVHAACRDLRADGKIIFSDNVARSIRIAR